MSKRRPKLKKYDIPDLPDAELDVIACLWKKGELTARQVREMMNNYRPMTHGSVMTLLKRLEEKGMVKKRKGPVGKAFLFSSAKKTQLAHKKLIKDLLDRVFWGKSATLVSSLFEAKTPTKKELEEIQTLLNELKKKKKK